MPFRDFEHNRVWLMLVGIAHDLLAWTQRLLLTGELAALRAQAPALPAAARRRAPRLSRPQSHATHRRHMALGRRARRRVHTRPSAPRPRLTRGRRARRPASPPRPRRNEPLPANGRHGAAHRARGRHGSAPSRRPTPLANPHTRISRRARRRDSHHAASCTIRASSGY